MSDRLIRSFWNGFDEDDALPPPFNYANSDRAPWLPPPLNGQKKEQEEDPWLPPKINAPRYSRQPQISLISGQNVTSLVDEPQSSPVTDTKETPKNTFLPTTNVNTELLPQAHILSYNTDKSKGREQRLTTRYTPKTNPKDNLTQSALESLAGGFYPDKHQLSDLGMTTEEAGTLMNLMSNHLVSNEEAYNIIAIYANGGLNSLNTKNTSTVSQNHPTLQHLRICVKLMCEA